MKKIEKRINFIRELKDRKRGYYFYFKEKRGVAFYFNPVLFSSLKSEI
jgi:hypothetical protein